MNINKFLSIIKVNEHEKINFYQTQKLMNIKIMQCKKNNIEMSLMGINNPTLLYNI